MNKLVLFDIDGTLLKHKTDKKYWRETLRQVYGVNAKAEEINYPGMIDPQIIQAVAQKKGVVEEEIKSKLSEALRRLGENIENEIIPNEITILPGVAKLLEILASEEDIILGLLTGNVRRKALAKLESAGLRKFFRLGAFGDDRETREELVDVAIKRAQRLMRGKRNGIRVFVVGDTPRDVRCAKANGVVAIAVASGEASLHELKRAQPDWLLRSLDDHQRFVDILKSEQSS